jgi:AGCS family alanine or glycine:cation symporter
MTVLFRAFALFVVSALFTMGTAGATAPADADDLRRQQIQSTWERAEEAAAPAPDPDIFSQMDQTFGRLVVGPLAKVMFFDLLFWDNQLELGRGLQTLEVPAELDPQRPHIVEVTSFKAGEGYGRQRILEVGAQARPLVGEPRTERIAGLQVNLQTEDTSGEPVVMARLPVQPVDLTALGIEEWDPMGPQRPVVEVMVPALGFRVPVDRRTRMLEPSSGPAPAGLVEFTAGEPVYDPVSARTYTAIAPSDDGWFVQDSAVAWSHDRLPNPQQVSLPVVVLWLVMGALFFTLRMLFINIRAFPHALAVVSGRYDGDHEDGEISHFQALSSALSATVGLGNIAGVAIAISLGGPGAVFWLWVAGFLGMSSKFTECTLGQMYREKDATGAVSGGPMYYLDKGLAEMGLGPLGKGLAIIFALMCIGGSLGGGNMFQANQSLEAVAEVVPTIGEYGWLYGLMLMIMVGFVIIGGIQRIGAAAGIVVPVMCGIYVVAGLYILLVNAPAVPGAFASIVTEAFSPEAGYGGLVGVLVTGFQRASFSNEAGVGSASIAHSAAATDEPIREGIVALLEPFIDTLVVCTVTALVVVVTGAKVPTGAGISTTMDAFATIIPWFPLVLAFAAILFAFSTMVSWSYYGERSAVWLFGESAVLPYRIVFLACVFAGSVLKLGSVLDFSDLMILGMAFPNILGAVLLSGKVKAALDAYLHKLHTGAFDKG